MIEMKYCIDPNAEIPVMFIDTHIGMDPIEGEGVMGNDFLRELLYLDTLGKSNIDILINSPGGVITDGMAIYHGIKTCKTPVSTYCIGLAASIAAVIFQAGTIRKMNEYGIMMLHNPHGGDGKTLKNFKEALIAMIAASGVEESVISKLMDKETWVNGNDPKYLGVFWDQVITTDKKIATKTITAYHQEATQVMNALLKNKKQTIMNEKLNELLGLTPETTETEMIAAISDLMLNKKSTEDKKAEIEAELEDAKKELKDAKKADEGETEMKKLAKVCEDLKSELDTLKSKIKAEEDKCNEADEADKKAKAEKKKVEAENLVEEAIASGKITNDEKVKNYWVAQVMVSEEAKDILSAQPVNMVGVDVSASIEKTQTENDPQNYALRMAAEVMNRSKKTYGL